MILDSIKTGRISAAFCAAVFAVLVHIVVTGFALSQLSRVNEILGCVDLAGPQNEECAR